MLRRGVGVLGLHLAEVGADDVEDQPLVGEDPLVAGDVALEADVFLRQLVGLQAGEALELHGEDGVGLHPGQAGRSLASGSSRARRRISAETSSPISRARASGGLAEVRITRMISSM